MSTRSKKSQSGTTDDSMATGANPSAQTAVELPANLEMVRLLGHGCMATVVLARDTVLKRLVAVKVLRKELSADHTCRRRFEREAQAAARLSHERVTTIYSVGRLHTDEPYIVMEYVDGDNLADMLSAQGPFSIDNAVDLLSEVSSALAAAHEQNIVHRDVKPSNILIDNKTNRATLTDFGVAAILESGSEAMTRLTRADERLGDPRYMSPEQLRGEALTGQSDIYSLGVIAYELLTGKGPFDDPDVSSMASAHLRRPPPDLRQRRANVPQALSDALKRCLSKSPEQRPRASNLPGLLKNPIDLSAGTGSGNPVAGFLQELKQRKVYKTAVAYAALSFLVLQIADLVVPVLTESTTAYRIIVITCLAGFPLAIVLAWVFDLRHGRLIRTAEKGSTLSRSATPMQRLLLKLGGLGLSITLVVVIARWLLLT